MTRPHAREALLACAAGDGDVAEGALWLAAEDCPGVEPARWLERIDQLAAELRTRCGIDGCGPGDAPLVAALLRDRLRLRGAGGGDPRSHYLHCVLERGVGVPIACSAVWIAVGRRVDIPVERRDRGLLLWRMGRMEAALEDINSYLDQAPQECADRVALTEAAGRLRAILN